MDGRSCTLIFRLRKENARSVPNISMIPTKAELPAVH